MIKSYTELNDQHIDVLKEIGNIGAGNAATSLGLMLNDDVSISVPELKIEDYNDVINIVGGPEEMIVAVMVNFYGEANGIVLFILSMNSAKSITDILVGKDEEETPILSEMKISAVKEIGNILGSAYLGSIAELTGMSIDMSVPYIAVDMTGAILAAPIVEYGAADSKVMFIEERFTSSATDLVSHVIMFTEMDSLRRIMNRLGLDI